MDTSMAGLSNEEYIGEIARTFVQRFKGHLKAPSPIYDHHNIIGHPIIVDNFSIVCREDHKLTRTIILSASTLANTICHIFGTKFYLTPKNLISNRPTLKNTSYTICHNKNI